LFVVTSSFLLGFLSELKLIQCKKKSEIIWCYGKKKIKKDKESEKEMPRKVREIKRKRESWNRNTK
jgi:hypothetical protein